RRDGVAPGSAAHDDGPDAAALHVPDPGAPGDSPEHGGHHVAARRRASDRLMDPAPPRCERPRGGRRHRRGYGDRRQAPARAGDALYMIRSGRVKVTTVDPQGNELVLNQCEPGEVIGELSLIDSSPRSATAIAMEPVQLLVLERQAFLDELGEHPALTMNVMR